MNVHVRGQLCEGDVYITKDLAIICDVSVPRNPRSGFARSRRSRRSRRSKMLVPT